MKRQKNKKIIENKYLKVEKKLFTKTFMYVNILKSLLLSLASHIKNKNLITFIEHKKYSKWANLHTTHLVQYECVYVLVRYSFPVSMVSYDTSFVLAEVHVIHYLTRIHEMCSCIIINYCNKTSNRQLHEIY